MEDARSAAAHPRREKSSEHPQGEAPQVTLKNEKSVQFEQTRLKPPAPTSTSPPPVPGPDSKCVSNEKCPKTFDPHDYGNADGLGVLTASIHIIRSSIGSGILMMPFLMRNLGYVTGTALMMAVGVIYYHNVHILVATEYQLCQLLQVKQLTFLGVTENTFQRGPYPINKFGPVASFLSNLYFSLPTAPATYLIVLSTTIRQMALNFDVRLDTRIVITVLAVPLIMFCMMRKILRILVPFSSAANVLTFLMAAVVMGSSVAYRNPHAAPKMFGDVYFVPKGFAMLILAVRSTGIMLPVKNDMRQPGRFSTIFGSINISGFTIIFLYYIFALTVYLNYGDEVPENVLSNMPEGNLVSILTYLFYSLSLPITYVLAFFVCFNSLWTSKLEPWLKPGAFKTTLEYCIRVGINLGAYFLAVYVPQISLIAEMAGTLGILVEIALPPFLQLVLLVAEKRVSSFIIVKNFFLISISAALFCMSLTRTVRDVIELYS